MTVLEAINKGAEFLERKGIESARLQSELLLAHILNLPRLKLYLNFERPLNDAESNGFRELLMKRGTRVPLQHLIGTTSFCGFPIRVTNAVLIPRPETELLAEEAWKFLKASNGNSFADVGTGSGCIAIAIAKMVPTARGVAVEISEDAIAIAKDNFDKIAVADRVELRRGDFLAALQPAERFDVIVSNPPYIPAREIELLEPEVRDHDPRPALDGGADGLDFYRAFAQGAAQFLQPAGRLMVEFGDGQAEALRDLFGKCDWNVHAILRDLSGRERILVASPTSSSVPATN